MKSRAAQPAPPEAQSNAAHQQEEKAGVLPGDERIARRRLVLTITRGDEGSSREGEPLQFEALGGAVREAG